MRRRLRLSCGHEHEAASPVRQQRRRECLRRVLNRSDEERAQEVPVSERRLLDRRAAAPAADEVHEPVDAAMALDETGGPGLRVRSFEQVDDFGLDPTDLRCQLVEPSLVAATHGWACPFVYELANHRRPEIPGAARHGDHPSVERSGHAATLATARLWQ